MKKIIFASVIALALLAAQLSWASQAVVRVIGVTVDAPGRIRVAYMVSVDAPTALSTDGETTVFSSAVNINFTASQNQFVTNLVNRAINQIVGLGGPTLATGDVWVFGGPQ